MPSEVELLTQCMQSPGEANRRLVYAQWLEERGDERAQFLRAQAAVRAVEPDHPQRLELEMRLSVARLGIEREWLLKVEPERAHLLTSKVAPCTCTTQSRHHTVRMHDEAQDTECVAWRKVLEAIDRAAHEQPEEFAPLRDLTAAEKCWIITLPPSIGRLKSVKRLSLYGSQLVRLPPEVGELTSLEEFVVTSSQRLHWFPYELTRCAYTLGSVTKRALYGNDKARPNFPRLSVHHPTSSPQGALSVREPARRTCSICRTPFIDDGEFRRWASVRVGTDVLPVLVHGCSAACLSTLPHTHTGGLGEATPATGTRVT